MLKFSLYFSIFTYYLFIFSCSTDSKRNHSQTTTSSMKEYIYQVMPNCEVTNGSMKVVLMSISGHPVGPTVSELFKSPDEEILRPFYSDGCSLSPDGYPNATIDQKWVKCCVKHDVAYWIGGSNISNTYRWGYGWNKVQSMQALTSQQEEQISLLYKKTRSELFTQFSDTKNLVKICDTQDPGLNSYNDDDKRIFSFLNSKLNNDERIVWARQSHFNTTSKEFELKFDSCKYPIKLIFNKKQEAPTINENDCHLFK